MKLDLTPIRSGYVAPTFGGDDNLPVDPALQKRMRRPMVIGAAIIGVLVIGLGLWASLSPLAQGIAAPGEVRVEFNKKTIRHKEAGTVREILVQEGQHVKAGQELIRYNDVETRAAYDVFQNQVDSSLAQSARFQAESVGAVAEVLSDYPDVPLVVPEINAEAAKNHPRNIIANPNCTTIISLMALAPLHEAFGLRSIIASTYQAVSGSGAQGIVELEEQMKAINAGEPVTLKVYPRQIAFNVIPQVDAFTENGYTKEEMKMLNEGRKIMDLPDLRVSCTCVRVPVYRSHSVSITAQFERPVNADAAQA